MHTLVSTAAMALDKMKALGAERAQCFVEIKRGCEAAYNGGDSLSADFKPINLLRDYESLALELSCLDSEGRVGSCSICTDDESAVADAARLAVDGMKSSFPRPLADIGECDSRIDFGSSGPALDRGRLVQRAAEHAATLLQRSHGSSLEGKSLQHRSKERVYLNSRGACLSQKLSYYTGEHFLRRADLDTPIFTTPPYEGMFDPRLMETPAEPLKEPFSGSLLIAPDGVRHLFWHSRLASFNDVFIDFGGPPAWRWQGHEGEAVASPEFSLAQRPLAPFVVGAERFGTDGFIARDFDLVKDGVFVTYPYTESTARRRGVRPSVTEFRYSDDLQYHIAIAPGNIGASELLGGIERGLLVFALGGSPTRGTGMIDSVLRSALLIEHGQVVRHVSCMLHLDFFEAIKHVRGISRELMHNGIDEVPWLCLDNAFFK